MLEIIENKIFFYLSDILSIINFNNNASRMAININKIIITTQIVLLVIGKVALILEIYRNYPTYSLMPPKSFQFRFISVSFPFQKWYQGRCCEKQSNGLLDTVSKNSFEYWGFHFCCVSI